MCMAKQIFFDDFNGSSLDASKWSPVWGKFDPDKGTQMRFTDKNIFTAPGSMMELIGSVATGTDAEKAPFLSGMVSTRKPDKGEVLFQVKGRFIFTVYAKMPKSGSSWPGIWMTGTKGDWPACGEIDVLEAKGWRPTDYQMNTHTPRAGEPTKSQQHEKYLSQTQATLKTAYNGANRLYAYSVVKLHDRVEFYLNSELVHTVMYSEMDDPTPFTDPDNGWVIKLSHIIGGSFLEYEGNREYVDATKHKNEYPSVMRIDSVHVISLDDPASMQYWGGYTDLYNIVRKYENIGPAPSPQPPTPSRSEPHVVVTPTPTPAPVPKPRSERAKNDWVREEDALVFIMM